MDLTAPLHYTHTLKLNKYNLYLQISTKLLNFIYFYSSLIKIRVYCLVYRLLEISILNYDSTLLLMALVLSYKFESNKVMNRGGSKQPKK